MRRCLLIIISIATLLGCVQDTFVDGDGRSNNTPRAATDLKYASSIETREFGAVITSPPTFNSYGTIPVFEIVEVRDGSGNIIDQEVIDKYISILNATEKTLSAEAGGETKDFNVQNIKNIGQINIEPDNPLTLSKYYFDIKLTTTFGDQVFESIFENGFELNMGPALADGLRYIPSGQNLLTNSVNNSTTEPIVFGGNPDIRFELGDNQDKFNINTNTGVIALNNSYVPTEEPEIVSPTINVVSNITNEVVSFNDAISIYISKNPVEVPKLAINVFYPTFESENAAYGYQIKEVLGGGNIFWQGLAPFSGASDDRPTENVNQKRLEINLVKSSASAQVPHESWTIMNSQDLSAFELGFSVEAEFYNKNRFIKYLSTDGSSPSLLEVYISTDYIGDFYNATWTDVTSQLESNIESGGVFVEGNEFTGLPYPGNQDLVGFPNPNNLKDPSKNNDNKWVRSTLNMRNYLGMANVTFAFKVYTTFKVGTISYKHPYDRSGRFMISDFNITAYEQ